MKTGKIITEDQEIKAVLEAAQTIAVVGLSPKPDRASYDVARYLKENGYQIIPVRPAQKTILGETAYPSLNDVDGPVDIINVFRRPDQMMAHAEEAVPLNPKVFWMQLHIENHDAALFLTARGINVIMNRCIKVDHDRLIKTHRI